MQVDTNVDESDVGPVRVGQQANFTVDAYPGTVFHGAVAQIRQAPINVQNVITYDVVVRLESGPEAVSGHDRQREDSDRAALKRIADSGGRAALPSGERRCRSRVQRRRGNAKATQAASRPSTSWIERELQAGAASSWASATATTLEVLSGLTEGQRVVTGAASAKPLGSAAPSAPGGTRRLGF